MCYLSIHCCYIFKCYFHIDCHSYNIHSNDRKRYQQKLHSRKTDSPRKTQKTKSQKELFFVCSHWSCCNSFLSFRDVSIFSFCPEENLKSQSCEFLVKPWCFYKINSCIIVFYVSRLNCELYV